MRSVQRLSDRFLGLFVKKVEADAIWYWHYFCAYNPQCSYDQVHWYPSYWREYCHDGSGYCQPPEPLGCC